jgi:signal transduction histidine kinase
MKQRTEAPARDRSREDRGPAHLTVAAAAAGLMLSGLTVAVAVSGVDSGVAGWDAFAGALLVALPGGAGCYAWYRRPGERFRRLALREQDELVDGVASYARIALENQRLAATVESSLAELRASRTRVIAAADEERRRIEGTLDDVGVLARGAFPPLLADRGLGEALRAAALRSPIAASVRPDGIARYPRAIESAVYFCCLEALQNASRHARGARAISILLAQDGDLRFEVRDDGDGFDMELTPVGAGLVNMRDRLAALGGDFAIRSGPGDGTVVSGSVPLGLRLAP